MEDEGMQTYSQQEMRMHSKWSWVPGEECGQWSRALMLPPYYGMVRAHVKCFFHFWASQLKKDMEVLERVQWRATEMVRGLDWSTFLLMRNGWVSWTYLAWRRCLHLSVFTNTLRTPKGVRGWGQALSSGGMSVWLSESWYIPYRVPDVRKG